MVKKRSLLRKIVFLCLGVMTLMTLTGCDGKVEDVVDNYEGELKARIEANQGEVEKIYKAGLLSEEQAKSLKEAISSQQSRITNMGSNDGKQYMIGGAGTAGAVGAKGEDAKGIEIISMDNQAIKELMDNLDFEVYVLKKDPLNTNKGENSLATLDLISKEVEKAKEGKASNIDSYFVNSGRKVWDTSKPENKIIKDTVPSGQYTNWVGCPDTGALTSNVNVLGKHFIGVKTEYNDSEDHKHRHSLSILELKLTEFNPDAVSRLVGADGVNKDVYVIVGKKCYLMQYPVQYVKGFKQEGNNFTAQYEESDMQINILTKKLMDKDGRVCTTTAGDILKVTGTGGYSELGEASFVIDGIKGPVTKFGFDPKKAEEAEENTGGGSRGEGSSTEEGQEEALPPNADKFGRVVLRDYLELNYMPTVVDGENLVALGRRIRLTNFKGTGQEVVGLFVDKSGNEIQNSLRIKITDLMDITSGSADKEGKRIKLDLKAVEGSTEGDSDSSSEDTAGTDDTSSVFEIGQSQNNLLTTEYATEINIATRFPGPLVATSDNLKLGVVSGEATETEGEDTETEGETTEGEQQTEESADNGSEKIKHFMYGMSVDVDPFQSNMFSGWIEITGDNGDIGSLDWWNNWLSESTYRYHIDRDKVINFLTGNYMYEMRENGNILLDIPTITDIQKQYNKEDKIAGANFITTLFTVLGFIVIAYSSLMLAAWVYDTNIIAGPRLMGLFSFGRWEAISDSDEMPYMDTQQKHYMTFGKTLKACVILIGVGVLIVFVDILHIVDVLILLFGKIAEIFGNVMQGIGM